MRLLRGLPIAFVLALAVASPAQTGPASGLSGSPVRTGADGAPDTALPQGPLRALPRAGAGADPCGRSTATRLRGGPTPDDATLAGLRDAPGGPHRIRVIRPGQRVTMDHWPGRLNIHLDDTGRVAELRCG